ncbi:MAG: hypothetical protein WC468_00935 [Candidatus Paceibacterota bacterium]
MTRKDKETILKPVFPEELGNGGMEMDVKDCLEAFQEVVVLIVFLFISLFCALLLVIPYEARAIRRERKARSGG